MDFEMHSEIVQETSQDEFDAKHELAMMESIACQLLRPPQEKCRPDKTTVPESDTMENYSKIAGVSLETMLDSGSSRIVLTSGTLKHIQECLQNQGKAKAKVKVVPAYKVTLAHGRMITSTTRLVANVKLFTPAGSVDVGNHLCTLLPGPLAPVLIGREALKLLGLKP